MEGTKANPEEVTLTATYSDGTSTELRFSEIIELDFKIRTTAKFEIANIKIKSLKSSLRRIEK